MPRATKSKTKPELPDPEAGPGDNGVAADLSYNEARTALELTLAELQSANLDVEAMAGLYQRAQSYANRCQTVLDAVEQQVMLWDSSDPKATPEPYQP
ncbi:MAG: exodeoxyribonuclease VII small subunit [Cyanobium sp. LacPavin_0920_WC12_MAG_62_9]|nr:exodeoxyribonuclease VII small subunit [Cyanobium sp. LacPavin_0920_WC12_MAG_62_9]